MDEKSWIALGLLYTRQERKTKTRKIRKFLLCCLSQLSSGIIASFVPLLVCRIRFYTEKVMLTLEENQFTDVVKYNSCADILFCTFQNLKIVGLSEQLLKW